MPASEDKSIETTSENLKTEISKEDPKSIKEETPKKNEKKQEQTKDNQDQKK